VNVQLIAISSAPHAEGCLGQGTETRGTGEHLKNVADCCTVPGELSVASQAEQPFVPTQYGLSEVARLPDTELQPKIVYWKLAPSKAYKTDEL
jgi:hypothetical protein